MIKDRWSPVEEAASQFNGFGDRRMSFLLIKSFFSVGPTGQTERSIRTRDGSFCSS